MRPKATLEDLYDTLSYQKWKTGLELIRELEDSGKKAWYFRGVMYIYLSNWENQGLIKSKTRSPERKNVLPIREYLRISTGKPIELSDSKEGGGLEKSLAPA